MPVFNSIIEETMTHMIHPISEQLVNRLFRSFNVLDSLQDNIYFNSDDTSASKTSDQNNRPKLTSNRANIEITPNFDPTNHKWENINTKNIPAYSISNFQKYEDASLFVDKRADIKIQEKLVPCTVSMNINLQFKSKELAFRTLDAIYNKHYTQSLINYEDIYYSYPFPLPVFRALHELYLMRTFEKELSFSEYLKWGSADNIKYNKSRNGNLTQIVINKNQYRVLSELITSVEKPEGEKPNKVADLWNIQFEYVYQFSRPNMMSIYYPVTVDNKLIPSILHPSGKRYHPTDGDGLYVDIAHQQYLSKVYKSKYIHPIVHHPIWDDWRVPLHNNHVNKFYKPFFVGALTLDEDETGTNTSIDLLNDLPEDMKLHQIIVDALSIQGDKSFYTEGLFNISVYANDTRVDPELLEITPELVVRLKSTIKHRRYHLVLSELVDLKRLDPYYIPILLKYDDFFASTIIRYLDYLKEAGEIEVEKGKIYIAKDRFIRVPHYGWYDGTGTSGLDKPDIDSGEIDPITEQPISNLGVEYSDLEGYEEHQDSYIFTKKGYPILNNQGGTNGFSNPWRVGRYKISFYR